jgi:hypothetical protein
LGVRLACKLVCPFSLQESNGVVSCWDIRKENSMMAKAHRPQPGSRVSEYFGIMWISLSFSPYLIWWYINLYTLAEEFKSFDQVQIM